ncbi:MAG: SpoIID/LytB domain-containing protein [Sumerlaeia bacterium]
MMNTTPEMLYPIHNQQYKMEEEPTLRVGVVLSEDQKTRLEFRTPPGVEYIVEGERDFLLPAGRDFHAESRVTADGSLGVILSQGTHVLWESKAGSPLVLVPRIEKQPRVPGMGLHVRNVVAGRGFHWIKEIDQFLPGKVEVQASSSSGYLLLINELSVEDYLIGVITSEMSQDCPVEYMKAQAVAARSWLFAQRADLYPNDPFDVCNDDQCQRYQGSEAWTPVAIRAIEECAGETLLTSENQYCDARYSKSTGGISEDAIHVWHQNISGLEAMIDAPKGDPIERFFPITTANLEEYLTGDWLAETKAYASGNTVNEAELLRYLGRVDVAGEYFRWEVKLKQADLLKALGKRGGIPKVQEVVKLIPQERGRSGRIKTLCVEYRESAGGEILQHTLKSEYAIRAGLSTSFLFSSCFVVRETKQEGLLESVTLVGAGWGHGAGLCQIGGLGRALKGQSYKEILLAYFANVRLENIYTLTT